ncbi:mCG1037090, partial [Mus musculus]
PYRLATAHTMDNIAEDFGNPKALRAKTEAKGCGCVVSRSLALSPELCAWVLKTALHLGGPESSPVAGGSIPAVPRSDHFLCGMTGWCCGYWRTLNFKSLALAEVLLEAALPLTWAPAGEALEHRES